MDGTVYEEELEEDDGYVDSIDLTAAEAQSLTDIIGRCVVFGEMLCDFKLYDYQFEFAYRVFESLILNDGAVITASFARQSGKSQTVAFCIATAMVLFPRLAKSIPMFEMFAKGCMFGIFAPVDEQAETLYERVVGFLTSEKALDFFLDPEIDDNPKGGARVITLKKSGSFCRRQTANPKAKIESKSYHAAFIDECFPAETPVLTEHGWVPIETVEPGVLVATQEMDGSVGWGHVAKTYKTPRHESLVRVDFEDGSVHATAGHPFMVDGRRVAAADLTPGTLLSVVPGAPEPWRTKNQTTQVTDVQPEAWVVARESLTAVPGCAQPHAVFCFSDEDVEYVAGDGAPTDGAWGQRSRSYQTAVTALATTRERVGGRVCVLDRESDTGQGATPRHTVALQDRRSEQAVEDRRGDRRGFTQHADSEGCRPPQGSVAHGSRVVCVEVLEPGSAAFDLFRDGGDFVYTLQVDSATHTYFAGGVAVGNCQEVDAFTIQKSISPMMAAYNGSTIATGTASRNKSWFYNMIQFNKRRETTRRGKRNHFEFDWRYVAKANPRYGKYIAQEKARLGEESDEFQLSYCCRWLLERGMFVTEETLDMWGDPSMGVVHEWYSSPCVAGIDPARKQDSTVVTVCWVDWNHPDEFGYMEHRVLNWLEITGDDWEAQYFQIIEFLQSYYLYAVGVDVQGIGDVVISRLRTLMPHIQFIDMESDPASQSTRWKHLLQLLGRGKFIYPAHSKARRLRNWKRFRQQFLDLEKVYKGKYLLAAAPEDDNEAHDDFPDSVALACMASKLDSLPEVEQTAAPW